jgi:hypothetical protein
MCEDLYQRVSDGLEQGMYQIRLKNGSIFATIGLRPDPEPSAIVDECDRAAASGGLPDQDIEDTDWLE